LSIDDPVGSLSVQGGLANKEEEKIQQQGREKRVRFNSN